MYAAQMWAAPTATHCLLVLQLHTSSRVELCTKCTAPAAHHKAQLVCQCVLRGSSSSTTVLQQATLAAASHVPWESPTSTEAALICLSKLLHAAFIAAVAPTAAGGNADGAGSIDPAALPLDSHCKPVYPHSFVLVNTIFEVSTAQLVFNRLSV